MSEHEHEMTDQELDDMFETGSVDGEADALLEAIERKREEAKPCSAIPSVEKHFVTFYSPGTFVAKDTTREIDSWDVLKAVEMSAEIKERHGAIPYGFRFTTRTRGVEDLDSHESARSPLYYLGGKIEMLEEIEARKDPKDKILISNMKDNGWDRVVVNTNSWKWTQPLEEGDVVLDVEVPE